MERRRETGLKYTQPTFETILAQNTTLQRAHALASEAHKNQTRAEGLPYISHCEAVAKIVYEEWGITEENMLVAALLHDVPEDTDVTLDQLRSDFGNEVAEYVEGLTQLRSEKTDPASKKLADKETLRKSVKNNLINPRITVLKLADRLHNMRTVHHMPEEKRTAKSWETLEIYARMAESLGMWKVKTELENLSFRYTDPQGYSEFTKLVKEDKRTGKRFIDHTISTLSMIVQKEGVDAGIEFQINSLPRLKGKTDEKPFTDINDVISFRVVVGDSGSDEEALYTSYKLLAAIQKEFREVEDRSRFDNFYLEPKDNGYSAIQITLQTPYGAVEIAITSQKKEEFNNWGIVSLIRAGKTDLHEHALKLVFTPTGTVKFLKPGDTGIDLAYSISEDMGAQAESILINGEPSDLARLIPNGAEVEIKLGGYRISPDKDLAQYASARTRRIMEAQFSEEEMMEQEKRGRMIVGTVISERGLLNLYDLLKLEEYSQKMVGILFKLGSKNSLSKLYRRVGRGLVSTERLKKQFDDNGLTKENMGLTSILIEGRDNSGLLNFFTDKIREAGGNIRRNYGESNGGNFRQHLVVEGLNKNTEKQLGQMFAGETRITNITVV